MIVPTRTPAQLLYRGLPRSSLHKGTREGWVKRVNSSLIDPLIEAPLYRNPQALDAASPYTKWSLIHSRGEVGKHLTFAEQTRW